MEAKHLYGLSAMLAGLGLICWALSAWLWELAVMVLLCGLAMLGVGLARLYLPVRAARHAEQVAWQSLALQERVIAHAERHAGTIKREASGTIEVLVRRPARLPQPQDEHRQPAEPVQEIPTEVRYEDIQASIPRDHVLIGVGEGGMVDTREKEIKGLIWIPGSSGAGKSNTTALRVEEDYQRGHQFLGIDPHLFKADSLSNLVRGYLDRFLEPIAYKQEDILRLLNLFIAEVDRRKAGGACWPLTLLYDEIGSQVAEKPEGEVEEQLVRRTKEVVRLAGQETRGFNMNVIAISQDAAGLAFLRKRALLVLGHKTVAMSERDLVCNKRTDIARQMDQWPVGRTVVYGVALQGILVRQQPLLSPRLVSTSQPVFPGAGNTPETHGEAVTEDLCPEEERQAEPSTKKEDASAGNELLETIRRMRQKGMSHREAAYYVGLSGRKYTEYRQLCSQAGLLEGEA